MIGVRIKPSYAKVMVITPNVTVIAPNAAVIVIPIINCLFPISTLIACFQFIHTALFLIRHFTLNFALVFVCRG